MDISLPIPVGCLKPVQDTAFRSIYDNLRALSVRTTQGGNTFRFEDPSHMCAASVVAAVAMPENRVSAPVY